MLLLALTLAQLHKARWCVELFFGWIVQQPRIKVLCRTLGNAVGSKIRIAVSIWVLVLITNKRLQIQASLYAILWFFMSLLSKHRLSSRRFQGTYPKSSSAIPKNSCGCYSYSRTFALHAPHLIHLER